MQLCTEVVVFHTTAKTEYLVTTTDMLIASQDCRFLLWFFRLSVVFQLVESFFVFEKLQLDRETDVSVSEYEN